MIKLIKNITIIINLYNTLCVCSVSCVCLLFICINIKYVYLCLYVAYRLEKDGNSAEFKRKSNNYEKNFSVTKINSVSKRWKINKKKFNIQGG